MSQHLLSVLLFKIPAADVVWEGLIVRAGFFILVSGLQVYKYVAMTS